MAHVKDFGSPICIADTEGRVGVRGCCFISVDEGQWLRDLQREYVSACKVAEMEISRLRSSRGRSEWWSFLEQTMMVMGICCPRMKVEGRFRTASIVGNGALLLTARRVERFCRTEMSSMGRWNQREGSAWIPTNGETDGGGEFGRHWRFERVCDMAGWG